MSAEVTNISDIPENCQSDNVQSLPAMSTVEQAIADIAAGKAVVVIDDADRENEADLIFAAEKATPELLAFTVRWSSGVICVALPGEDCDRLHLPPMWADNQDPRCTAFTVSVDVKTGITTGISAADRAKTIHALADPLATAEDLRRPGHIFPLRAMSGGVLSRTGHTEAALDLATLAGLRPAGVLCELVNDDGTMKRGNEVIEFADEHQLTVISIADLVSYRNRLNRTVRRVVDVPLPTPHGIFRAVGYQDTDGRSHIAMVYGDLAKDEPALVRMHSECLTGDVFGSLRCDCGSQVDAGLRAIAAEGSGVLLYLRGHEGRGIGLLDKLRAYQLQDAGHDTVDANLQLGLPADARDYRVGACMLADLGVQSVRLLSNNPAKQTALEQHGITVTELVGLLGVVNGANLRYLRTKRDRMGHHLPDLTSHDSTSIADQKAE